MNASLPTRSRLTQWLSIAATATLLAVQGSDRAQAQVRSVTYTDATANSGPGFQVVLDIPPFDPTLGTLTDIVASAWTEGRRSMGVRNFGNSGSCYDYRTVTNAWAALYSSATYTGTPVVSASGNYNEQIHTTCTQGLHLHLLQNSAHGETRYTSAGLPVASQTWRMSGIATMQVTHPTHHTAAPPWPLQLAFDPSSDSWGWGATVTYEFTPSAMSAPMAGAVANSTGNVGTLEVFGSADVQDEALVIEAADLPPEQIGFLLMSESPGLTVMPAPNSGVLLLGTPVYRHLSQIQQSDGDGIVSFPLDFSALPAGVQFLPGDTWYFQYWHRDSDPTPTSNTTEAAAFTFQ